MSVRANTCHHDTNVKVNRAASAIAVGVTAKQLEEQAWTNKNQDVHIASRTASRELSYVDEDLKLKALSRILTDL